MADILIKTENNNKVVEIKNENEIGNLGNAIGMRGWNQLVQDVGSTNTMRGVTFTKNGNGSYTINGTASQGNAENLVSTSFPVQTNHKYLVFGAKGNAKIQVWAKNATESKGIDNGRGFIFTGLSTDINLIVYIRVDMNTTVNNITLYPQLFDLTQLFGEGNEPTTVEEFKAIFPADYYPYHPINDLSDFGYSQVTSWSGGKSIKLSDDMFLDASSVVLGTNHDLLDQMLNPRSVAISNSFTFSQLIAKNVPTYFSNWNDNTNFPEYYGVGVYIPTVDPSIKFILYLTVDGGLYLGKYQNNAITWRHYINS